jgi:hypothetical protein
MHSKTIAAQSPTPVTGRKKPRSTPSSHPHILARPSSPPPPSPTAPIIATIQVDINESLLKQSKKRISWRQSGLISRSAAETRVLVLARPGVVRPPLLREHPAPRSARRCGAMLGLQRKKKSMRRSTDTGQRMPTRRSSGHQAEGRRSVH